MSEQIIIVGAGIGGLSAAIRLAVAGRKVIVLEKNHEVGGKVCQVADQGFQWDAGPTLITMPSAYESLFAAAGRRFDDYVRLIEVEPLTRYFFAQGAVLDAGRDRSLMDAQIAAIEPRDVAGYHEFLAYARRLYDITRPVFIEGEPPGIRSLRHTNAANFLRIDPLRTLHQAVAKRLHSQEMQMLFDRFATYVGADPYRAPAALAAIAHLELHEGVWYPQGGVYQLAHAYWRLALEVGVEVHAGVEVKAIAVEKERATGVILDDGSFMPAQVVLSNLDVTATYQRLLPKTRRIETRLHQLRHSETSCSGFVLLLGVDGVHPQLRHHNLFFPKEYRSEFHDLFARRHPPEEPAIYLAITSKSDPSHAPDGCENWFLLVNAPATSKSFDWRHNAHEYGDHILDRLASRGLDVRERILVRKSLTPVDIERISGAWRGALYGISSNHALSAFRRPHIRCPDLRGLYFVGGTTHPGGGVPMVTLSGAAAARIILRDLLNG